MSAVISPRGSRLYRAGGGAQRLGEGCAGFLVWEASLRQPGRKPCCLPLPGWRLSELTRWVCADSAAWSCALMWFGANKLQSGVPVVMLLPTSS